MKLSPIYLATKIVLHYRPDLRRVDNREEVIKEVRKFIPHASLESVTRQCRHIQNTEGLYLPAPKDNREMLEKEYIGYFRPVKNGGETIGWM